MDKTNFFWRHKAGKPERARLLSNSENRENLKKNFRNDDWVLANYNKVQEYASKRLTHKLLITIAQFSCYLYRAWLANFSQHNNIP